MARAAAKIDSSVTTGLRGRDAKSGPPLQARSAAETHHEFRLFFAGLIVAPPTGEGKMEAVPETTRELPRRSAPACLYSLADDQAGRPSICTASRSRGSRPPASPALGKPFF